MKVLMICNTDGALYVFRRPIIEALLSRGVAVASISGASNYIQKLRSLGVSARSIDFSRHSLSIFSNLKLFRDMWRLVKAERPDIAHCFTHKPATIGVVAARLAGVRRVFVTITGLGTLFIQESARHALLKQLLLLQYRVSLRLATQVYFQNPDDLAYFVDRGIVHARKATLTGGSGLDTDAYPMPSSADCDRSRKRLFDELASESGGPLTVLFPARATVEKGLLVFYQAAKLLNDEMPGKFRFLHIGLIDEGGKNAHTREAVRRLALQNGVLYLGHKENVFEYLMAVDIVALPSFREGLPRSLLEAMAMGRAIVTTDVPGCRETVEPGVNGLLCRARDPRSLADAIASMTPEFIETAGAASRRLLEERFSARALVETTLRDYGLEV